MNLPARRPRVGQDLTPRARGLGLVLGLVLGLGGSVACLGPVRAQTSPHSEQALGAGDACARDLEAIPGFLMENDAGARDLLPQRGEQAMAAALLRARGEAAQIADDRACLTLLNNYLKLWRKGHLWVSSSPGAEALAQAAAAATATATATAATPAIESPPVARQPTLRLLTPRTLVIHLPSFSPPHRAALEALLRKHRAALQSHPNWIIDVRDNDGGADSSYAPLLPWLLAEQPVSVGVEWLSTPANQRAHEQICARYAPGDAACALFAQSVLSALRAAPAGSWARVQAERFVYEGGLQPEKRRPQKVAVLMDRDCGSSCEQFLLTVRQGLGVKLLGRPSFGALDYSNMRPFALPSGRRDLWYTTSRSLRLPQLPVDAFGVLPDILLPELQAAQRWLEGGSLQRVGAAGGKP
ncbi:MAG TPA: S41 family peptidase [Burkholderiaceae bacterium]|nr:S41 family peptidase [Burkholderiaceae bacterium]